MRPTSVEELSLVNACIRPSGETYRDALLNREIHKNPSELIDNILKDNLGWLVYQEDTLAFLQQICGFSGSEADSVRRAIGKKREDEINAALPKILDGYCAKSDKPRKVAEKEAKEFLDVISSSSSYQFGKNHSIAYSLISYNMGYYRYYYPTEFCTAFMNCAKNDDDIQNGTKLALSKGCRIVAPQFRHSLGEYSCDATTKTIYKGLSSIKYMSDQIADELYALRNNQYNSFVELLDDINSKTSCNSRQLDILIKLDFFEEFGEMNKLLETVRLYDILRTAKTLKFDKLKLLNLKVADCEPFAEKITAKTIKLADAKGLLEHIVAKIHVPEASIKERLQYQNELLGYVSAIYPQALDDYYYVSKIKGDYSRIVTLYQLRTGDIWDIKIKKSKFEKNPVQEGDIIRVKDYGFEKKWRKDESKPKKEQWYQIDELEEILQKYVVLT